MSDLTIARRYALALAETASTEGKVDAVDADVEAIRGLMSSSRDLMLFFSSPVISRDKKADVIRALFKDKVEPVTLRFLGMMVEKSREDLIPMVLDAFHALRNEMLGIVDVEARVAFPLSDTDQQALKASFGSLTGKSVRLTTRVDTDLMGGIVVQVGDTVYDGSVKNQLATLQERLAVS